MRDLLADVPEFGVGNRIPTPCPLPGTQELLELFDDNQLPIDLQFQQSQIWDFILFNWLGMQKTSESFNDNQLLVDLELGLPSFSFLYKTQALADLSLSYWALQQALYSFGNNQLVINLGLSLSSFWFLYKSQISVNLGLNCWALQQA